MSEYDAFVAGKEHAGAEHGFSPTFLPSWLFDFQAALVEWATRKGRCAILADCGLGKSAMQLVWAENIARHTNRPVLILTPLAVAEQTIEEAEKFGIEAVRSKDGQVPPGAKIVVANYERLHLFRSSEFTGCVCDESSILKSFDGARKALVTEFLRTLPYRLLCTATAAPNDYVELGTSSEALGELGYMDMLGRFFKNDQHSNNPNRIWTGDKWRFKRHAGVPFWRWVCSWARAVRKPSDLGFADDRFRLPKLIESSEVVKATRLRPGFLFDLPAVGLREQREDLRRTITERCERAAAKLANKHPALAWCHLNDEADLLETMIGGARQVSGAQSDDEKEEIFRAFAHKEIRALVTKPKIGAWGLNWQHCSQMTYFPSHSFEQYYQSTRRCWRYGQKCNVEVHCISTEGQRGVLDSLREKAKAAGAMFEALVEHMNNTLAIRKAEHTKLQLTTPEWLK